MSDNQELVTTAAPVAPVRTGNGLGIAALVLGIVAIGVAFIPIAGVFLTWVPALVGIGLGIATLVIKSAQKVLGIIGLALSVIAIPVGIATLVAGAAGVKAAFEPAAEESKVNEVVYQIDGDGGTASVYYTADGDGVSTSKSLDVTLPWSLTINSESAGEEIRFNSFFVMASSGSFDSSTIVNLSCKIIVDGEVVTESSDSAGKAIVTCLG